MTASLNHDALEQLLAVIASARKKSPEDMRALVDQGPLLPEAALQHRLVDELAYYDEIGMTSRLGDDSRNSRPSGVSPRHAGHARGPQRAPPGAVCTRSARSRRALGGSGPD